MRNYGPETFGKLNADEYGLLHNPGTTEGTHLTPLPIRHAWPPETDPMALLAGLEMENRWGGWDKSDFTANSWMHISVYRKPA